MPPVYRILTLMSLTFLTALPSSYALTLQERAAIYESYALEEKLDYVRAAQKVASVFEKNKTDYFLNLRMGWLLSYAKLYKNSVDHYKNAAKLAPNALEPWLAISLLYLNIGDPAQSLPASAEVLKRDPANYYGLMRTTIALIRTKQYTAALLKVDEALKIYPIDPTFLEQKGFLMVNTGRPEAATEPLSLLLLVSPQNEYAKSILKQE